MSAETVIVCATGTQRAAARILFPNARVVGMESRDLAGLRAGVWLVFLDERPGQLTPPTLFDELRIRAMGSTNGTIYIMLPDGSREEVKR